MGCRDLRGRCTYQRRRERRAGAGRRSQAAAGRDPGRQADPGPGRPAGWGFDDFHRAQPSVVSLTQSTEAGTVYTLDEMRAIADHAHALHLKVHVDGSRLSNAAAHLGCTLAEITSDVGVDVLSFGGTKNGLLYGECVVAFDDSAADGLVRLRKMDMQLSSKMRFVSAQLIAVLTDDLWRRNANQANGMAALLRSRLEAAVATGSIHAEFPRATEANELFVRADVAVTDRLAADFPFETWDRSVGEVRFVCSFDTQASDIDALVEAWLRAVEPVGDRDVR